MRFDELTKKEKSSLSDMRFEIEFLKQSIESYKGLANKMRNESNLGDRFKSRTFDTFDVDEDNKRAYMTCNRYAEKFLEIMKEDRNSIVLFGGYGTGKTHLAASVANYLIDNLGTPVVFGTFSGLLDKIKNEFTGTGRTLNNMCNAPLLIIDDLGKEKRSDWVDEVLFKVINSRYENKLPIIITTNLTQEQFIENYDSAVVSRVIGSSYFIEMKGGDKRWQ